VDQAQRVTLDRLRAPGRFGGGNRDGELVPDEVRKEERWCTHCRGTHDPRKVGDPRWRPYTPRVRLENLGIVGPQFAGLYEAGMLPVDLKETTTLGERPARG